MKANLIGFFLFRKFKRNDQAQTGRPFVNSSAAPLECKKAHEKENYDSEIWNHISEKTKMKN